MGSLRFVHLEIDEYDHIHAPCIASWIYMVVVKNHSAWHDIAHL